MRLDAEYVGMHIGEVAHVEKVLDGARRRDVDAERCRIELAAVRLLIFGDREQLGRRRPERSPDIAIGAYCRQPVGGWNMVSPLHIGTRAPDDGLAIRVHRKAEALLEQNGLLDGAGSSFRDGAHGMPEIEDHGISAFRHHVIPSNTLGRHQICAGIAP